MARAWNGYHVLATLLATFAVVLGVNVLFIVKAYTTFSGEDEQKPYLQGIGYNQTLERHALQLRLGWTAMVDATRVGHSVRIVVHLAGRSGKPVSNISLVALLKHPSDEARDRVINLHPVGAGTYQGIADEVQSGGWDLSVAARNAPTTPFEADRRIWLR
jgi:nitrogen fixation protein FixH